MQCGFEWLRELVLRTGKDEEGKMLGDSANEKDLSLRGCLGDEPHQNKRAEENSVEKAQNCHT